MSLYAWWKALLELIFPASCPCVFCWKEIEAEKYRGICEACSIKILKLSKTLQACPRCGYFTTFSPCPNCCDWADYLERSVSVVPNDGIYREFIYSLKFENRKEIAVPLAFLMYRKLKMTKFYHSINMVIPVPLHPDRESERGYNQSSLLAREIARELAVPCVEILSRVKYIKTQTGLSRRERKNNMAGVFALNSGYDTGRALSGLNVLLVDDIITTGMTLSFAAKILKKGGAQRVYGLTWAAGADPKQFVESCRKESPGQRIKAIQDI